MKSKFYQATAGLLACSLLFCGCSNRETRVFSNDSTSAVSSVSTSKSTVTSGFSGTSRGSSSKPNSTSSTSKSSSSTSSSSTEPSSVSSPIVISSSEPVFTQSSSSPVSSAEKPPAQSSSTTSSALGSSTTEIPVSTATTTATSSTSTASEQTPSEPAIYTSNSVIDNYTKKWAYNHINAKQQEIYTRLFKSVKGHTETFSTEDLGVWDNDIYTAYWAFDYDNPQFLELGSGYSYEYIQDTGQVINIKINYGRTSNDVPQGNFNEVTQSVIAQANALGGDYDKLKYVHDWIVNNTNYINQNTAYESEADGPVIYGKAICEGYSKAFMYFAQSLGYQCVCIIGTALGEEHMWNMVNIGGAWYNVDVTWDDPVMSDGSSIVRYNYFLVSDGALSADHIAANPFEVPTAGQSYS